MIDTATRKEETMSSPTRDEVIEQLFADICHLAHKHEVQTWKDATGTDAEKLKEVLKLARNGLGLIRGKLRPHEA